MSNRTEIKCTVSIQNHQIFLNNDLIFERQNAENFSSFAKAYYQELGFKYPKFYKMDRLSKLGFLGFETLLKGVPNLENYDKEKVGIFFMNRHSSLDTDERYFETFTAENTPPSPSLFVYTLPNIVIGEICIRHKIKGEHGFFVGEQFDSKFFHNYVKNLFKEDILEACAVGWVDYYQEYYKAEIVWLTSHSS